MAYKEDDNGIVAAKAAYLSSLPQKLYDGKPAKSEYTCICMCGAHFFGHKRDCKCPDCEKRDSPH